MNPRVLLLSGMCVALIALPLLVRDPMEIRPYEQLRPPSSDFLLGTDLLGRDVFARLVHGGRETLVMAFGSAGAALIFACVLRAMALIGSGWFGDGWLVSLSRALLAIPPVVLALVLSSLSRRNGDAELGRMLTVGIVLSVPFLRVMMAGERVALVQGYVEASRAMGGTQAHIWRVHVLRTIAPQLGSFFGITCAHAMLLSASLGFLGFGGDWSAPEWGRMLFEGRQVLRAAPWVALAPGLGITLLTLIVLSVARWAGETGISVRRRG
jgi:peptide/nickel transport system permease protein